jgi:hypothetical protein
MRTLAGPGWYIHDLTDWKDGYDPPPGSIVRIGPGCDPTYTWIVWGGSRFPYPKAWLTQPAPEELAALHLADQVAL